MKTTGWHQEDRPQPRESYGGEDHGRRGHRECQGERPHHDYVGEHLVMANEKVLK